MRRSTTHWVHAAAYDPVTRALERAVLGERRARLLSDLEGEVLDVGAGTGANLPYLRRASRVVAAEPDTAMRRRLAARVPQATVPVEVSSDPAEKLRYRDASFDAVVFTLALCTVTSPDRALAEARRLLKPSGRLVILEHVRGTGTLAQWQYRLTPLWSLLNAGCHLDRDTAAAVERTGFTFDRADYSNPFPRLVPAQPLLEAVARPAGPAG
jgi:ubiquinone/menaquinone biosynthesis C-methylase UbiE